MKRFTIVFSALLMLFVTSAVEITADERPAYDIILIVDKSISMEESKNLEVTKNFLTSSILEENVKIGDFLIIMDFWGQAEIVDSFSIQAETDRQRAKSLISSIISTKRETNTDIGNAIDIAKAQVDVLGCSNRPKIVLLLTDGIQEAPRFSKYYSADHTITNNVFLNQSNVIAKQGWKIYVIEIGGAKDFIDTAAAKGAALTGQTQTADTGAQDKSGGLKGATEKLGGEYKGVSEKPTLGELNAAVEGMETRIDVVNPPKQLVVPSADRMAEITLTMKGQGLGSDVPVVVNDVRLTAGPMQEKDIFPSQTYQFTVPKDGTEEVTIKLSGFDNLPPGDYPADIQFYFEGSNAFYPKALAVNLHVNNFLENNLILFIIFLIAGLLLIAFLVFLLIRLILSSGVKFRLKVEEQPLKKGKDVFKVGYGKWLYLNEAYGRLTIAPKRSLRSIGRVYGVKKGLEFEPLREEQFPGLKAAKQNILGQKITIKTQDSVVLHAEFIKI